MFCPVSNLPHAEKEHWSTQIKKRKLGSSWLEAFADCKASTQLLTQAHYLPAHQRRECRYLKGTDDWSFSTTQIKGTLGFSYCCATIRTTRVCTTEMAGPSPGPQFHCVSENSCTRSKCNNNPHLPSWWDSEWRPRFRLRQCHWKGIPTSDKRRGSRETIGGLMRAALRYSWEAPQSALAKEEIGGFHSNLLRAQRPNCLGEAMEVSQHSHFKKGQQWKAGVFLKPKYLPEHFCTVGV